MTLARALQQGTLRKRLAENRARRDAAAKELEHARVELGRLLIRGKKLDLTVTEMARLARIRRERAHEVLRGVERRDRTIYKREGGKTNG